MNLKEAYIKAEKGNVYYTKNNEMFLSMVKSIFISKDIPVRVYYDTIKQMYVFGNAFGYIHADLATSMKYYSKIYGVDEMRANVSYLKQNCALFQVLPNDNFKEYDVGDGYTKGRFLILDDLIFACREKEYTKVRDNVPLFKNHIGEWQDVQYYEYKKSQQAVNESIEYIDNIEVLINPSKQELQKFMKRNRVYRVLLTDNDIAIWKADSSLLHNDVEQAYKEFSDSENLFALNGNIFFVDYDMKPEEIEDFYFEKAEKLDNLPIVKKYFPHSQMKKALDMMKNGISIFNAPNDWHGWLNESVEPKLNDNFWKWFGNSKMKNKNGKPIIFYHTTYSDINVFEPVDYVKGNFVPSEKGIDHYHFSKYKDWTDNFAKDEFVGKEYQNRKTYEVFLRIEKPLVILPVEKTVEDWVKYLNSKNVNISLEEILHISTFGNDFDNEKIYKIPTEIKKNKEKKAEWLKNAIEQNKQWYANRKCEFWRIIRNSNKVLSSYCKKAGYDGILMRDTKRGDARNLTVIVFNSNQIKSINNNGNWSLNSNNINESVEDNFNSKNNCKVVLKDGRTIYGRFIDKWKDNTGKGIFIKSDSANKIKEDDIKELYMYYDCEVILKDGRTIYGNFVGDYGDHKLHLDDAFNRKGWAIKDEFIDKVNYKRVLKKELTESVEDKILYIIRGVPGSGKSTLAHKLTDNVVEADQYFYDDKGNYNWSADKLNQAHNWCYNTVKKYMEEGRDKIAVANTFVKKRDYKRYVELAEQFGYKVDIRVCNGNYKNIHGVPDETVERMRAKFQLDESAENNKGNNKMIELKKLLKSTYILNEGIEEVKKYFPNVPEDKFETLVKLDPTYQGGNQLGKFGKWILGLYNKGQLKDEDFYKVTEYLTTFRDNLSKAPNKDIMSYKSLPDLAQAIQPFEGQKDVSKKQQVRNIKKDAKVILDANDWLVISPQTEEASCYYGANTKWCTAAKEHNMFDEYNEQGPLYIFIRKSTGAKYQFHAETFSFMDATDKPIAPKKVIGEPDVLDVINNAFDAKIDDIDFEENNPIMGLIEDEEGQAVIVIDDVWDFILNLFDTHNYIKNILSDYIEGNEIDIDDIKCQYSEYFNIDIISDELEEFCNKLETDYKSEFDELMDRIKWEIISQINDFSKFFKVYYMTWKEEYEQLFLYVKDIEGEEYFDGIVIDWFMNENQNLYMDNIFDDICTSNASKAPNTEKIIKIFCEGLKDIMENNDPVNEVYKVIKNPDEKIIETYLQVQNLRFAYNPMSDELLICDELHNPINLNESKEKYITGILSPKLVEVHTDDSKEIIESLLGRRLKKIFGNHYEIITY